MEFRTLGRTGLKVSLVGLGAGGASLLGLGTGGTEAEAIAVVHRAIELGINYFDTAEMYGTEEVLGRGLDGHRGEAVLSSKRDPRRADGSLCDALGLREELEASLARLRTDHLDVYHLHRVKTEDYAYCVTELLPALERARAAGLVRFLGISESSGGDARHEMLGRAVTDNLFDVVMVGFNLFNQSARERVLPGAIDREIGVEIVTAARTEFSNERLLAEATMRLFEAGEVTEAASGTSGTTRADPLAYLHGSEGRLAVTEVSYRFAAAEPGVHTVLVGTGNLDHLEENVAALGAGPLPPLVHEELLQRFGHLALRAQVPGRFLR